MMGFNVVNSRLCGVRVEVKIKVRVRLGEHGIVMCDLVPYKKIQSRDIPITMAFFFPALPKISVIIDFLVCFSTMNCCSRLKVRQYTSMYMFYDFTKLQGG